MLSSPVLVLNQSYFPVHITSVRRAFCMLYSGIAKVVDQEYRTFDFQSWSALSVAVHDESVGMIDRIVRVPRVILLIAYDRLPKREVRFSRLNILIRDNYTCQYCGHSFKRSDLNLDHVVPRSQGGLTTWENVVVSCLQCNHHKGGHLLKDVGMGLIRKPFRPKSFPFSTLLSKPHVYDAWRPFLNVVDFSYWNVELEP